MRHWINAAQQVKPEHSWEILRHILKLATGK